MNLTIPVPTVTPGSQYAFDEVSCFNQIDQHNHTSGLGVQIPTAGLNINSNLPLNNYGLLNTQLVNLQAQASISTNGSVYRKSVDLYYLDGSGNDVRITQGGSVAVSGAIGFTGLPSGTASASYNAPSQTFIFQSATNTPANIDGASIIVRPLSASPQGITISAPSPLASSYSLELAASLPAATKIVQLSSTGAITSVLGVDNSTIEISSNNLQVKNLGITDAKIAVGTITGSKIASATVTQTNLANNSVGTNQLIDASVTAIKKSDTNYATANLSNYTGSGPIDLGNVSLTTTAANSVLLVIVNGRAVPYLFSVDASLSSYIAITLTGPGGYSQALYLGSSGYGSYAGSSAMYLTSAAGTYTATVRIYSPTLGAFVTNMLVKIVEIR
jgi:hypothetical protein